MTGDPRVLSDDGRSAASAAASWDRVLTRLEAQVDAAEQALATGTAEPTGTYVAPVGLGPLPPHLRERAWLVHDRCRATTDALARAAAAVAGEMRNLETRQGDRPTALYVDSRC